MKLISNSFLTLSVALALVFSAEVFAQTDVTTIVPPRPTEPYNASPAVSEARLHLFEDLFYAMANDVRKSAGKSPLPKNEALRTAARSHSQDIAIHHLWSHAGSLHENEAQRADAAGACGFNQTCVYVSENMSQMNFVNLSGLQANFSTDPGAEAIAKKMIGGMINSTSGHYENMIDSEWEETAIGVAMGDDYTLYLTQNFIRLTPRVKVKPSAR